MQELLLVGNPAPRRKSRKAPSPAQKAARAKFAAMARARSNPAKRRTKRRAAPVVAAKRRTKHRKHAVRRNPITARGFGRGITPRLKMAAIGGLGAFGVDVAYGYAQSYLPAAIQSPVDLATGGINFMYYAAKGAAALGIGMVAAKMIGASRAAHIADASLTVTAHDLIKHFAAANLSTVPVAGRMGRMPGGRIIPPLPISQNLRKYDRLPSSVGMYPGVSANARDGNLVR